MHPGPRVKRRGGKSTLSLLFIESASSPTLTHINTHVLFLLGGDYCYDPYFETPKPHLKFRDKDFCTNFICSLCEGPCDNDDQCKGSYKCLRRNPGQSVPGCRGGNNDDSESGYCYDPDYKSIFEAPPPDDSIFPELDYKGREYCDKHLCDLCQGDCDSDADCRGNLVCHKRGENDNVPGCKGGAADNSGVDYCVLPSRGNDELKVDKYPNLRPNGREHCSKDSKCGVCEGDCDSVSGRTLQCLVVCEVCAHKSCHYLFHRTKTAKTD